MNRSSSPSVILWLLAAMTTCSTSVSTAATRPPLANSSTSRIELDLPAWEPSGFARTDTLRYGYVQEVGGNLYAVEGETWTFDHGSGSLEGWYAVDLSVDPGTYFRRVTASDWTGHDNAVAAPLLAGDASLWVGVYEDIADSLCWESGLGYGNSWRQRLTSPLLSYAGAGDVTVSFLYFNDTEVNFDYSRVLLRLLDGTEIPLNDVGYTGKLGAGSGATLPVPQSESILVTESTFEGQSSWQLVFEFTSDGGWSDEDGVYTTDYGPFGVDDVTLAGGTSGSFDFESDLQGWSAGACEPIGSFFGLGNMSDYAIADLCACDLSANVLRFHDAQHRHPYGQHVQAFSPPADKSTLGPEFNWIAAEWDEYRDLPSANGVFQRVGWNYYPYICPVTGQTGWSGRVGDDQVFFAYDDPACIPSRNVATDVAVPASASLVGFVYEVFASCDAFGVPSTVCTHDTNFSPIVDNVQILVSGMTNAPRIAFAPGARFIDGFGQAFLLSTTNAGNADIAFDLHRDNPGTDLLGDSLVITGPVPSASTKWEAQMWWRLRREGPSQSIIPGYTTWKTSVADGRNIVGPTGEFTFGRMDSMQIGTQTSKHHFISEFREDDDDFAGEGTHSNEMLRDGILAPGTQVEYFVSANYIGNPEHFLLPDTTGRNYLEFEILPSYRNVGGVYKFPCLLQIDLNTGTQFFVEHALNQVMNGAGPGMPIPNPTTWDRYDYDDATSNWNAPLARLAAGNNGVSIGQLIFYRQIILCTDGAIYGAMETADFSLFDDWLSIFWCDANTERQGFIANGDNLGTLLTAIHPSFLWNRLGATVNCDAYNEAGCGPNPADESYCVRVNNAPGSLYAPAIEYGAYGNGCPNRFVFDVLNANNGGAGNRVYNDYDASPPTDTNYEQVVKSVTSAVTGNFRAVLDGVSFKRLSRRDASVECVADSAHIVAAVAAEVDAALDWIFGNGVFPAAPYCLSGCSGPSDVGSPADDPTAVNRLNQNTPNPFNPRTRITFSLAVDGPAKLVIYDVSGRVVKTLFDGPLKAGRHESAWDGSNDLRQRVGSGVFWSQLSAGEYVSNRKMILLK